MVDQRGGVIIAAHPYRRRFLEEPAQNPQARADMLEQASQDEFFGYCDALEELNGRGSTLDNQFSHDLREHLGVGATGGSDGHRTVQLGAAATRFDRKIAGLSDLIEALRLGGFNDCWRPTYPSSGAG